MCCVYVCVYEKERERESSFCWFIPQMVSASGLGQGQVSSQEFHPGLPCACQEPSTWAVICCLPAALTGGGRIQSQALWITNVVVPRILTYWATLPSSHDSFCSWLWAVLFVQIHKYSSFQAQRQIYNFQILFILSNFAMHFPMQIFLWLYSSISLA